MKNRKKTDLFKDKLFFPGNRKCIDLSIALKMFCHTNVATTLSNIGI